MTEADGLATMTEVEGIRVRRAGVFSRSDAISVHDVHGDGLPWRMRL